MIDKDLTFGIWKHEAYYRVVRWFQKQVMKISHMYHTAIQKSTNFF